MCERVCVRECVSVRVEIVGRMSLTGKHILAEEFGKLSN